jgi:radical SAM protein with 4Fe4S-binding SPASM domain
MCPRSRRQGTQKLDRTVLEGLVQELFPTARKAALSAAAGEPLLADFEWIAEAAGEWDVSLDLVTNGTRLTGELYRKCRAQLDHVNVSLDSHDPETYARIRAGGRLEHVRANLEEIRDLRRAEPDGVLLSLSFVETRLNLAELPEFVRFAARMGVDGVICQSLRHDVFSARKLDVKGHALDAEPNHRVAAEVAREVRMNLFLGEVGQPNIIVRPIREKRPAPLEGQGLCWFLAQYMGVQPNGDVFPCCLPSDHRLGNLFDESARSIWNGEPMQRLRRDHFEGRGDLFCRGCAHAPHLGSSDGGLVRVTARKARMAVSHLRGKLEERTRPRRRAHAGRIFYVCNWAGHSGGISVLYDHVRGLRELGYQAWLASYGEFERCDWFSEPEGEAPSMPHFLDQLLPEDLVVLPEVCMWDEQLLGVPGRQVVFVQNPDLMSAAADDPRFSGMVAVSTCLEQVIRGERHYSGPLQIIHPYLESRYIAPLRWMTRGQPRILLVDRVDKNRGEPRRVRQALQARGFDVTLIEPSMHRDRFVELFRAHDVYFHLSYREGFPLSVLEAFGAGCLVVGFAGRGGLEFMRDGENCLVVEDGDWRSAVLRFQEELENPRDRLDSFLAAAHATVVGYDRPAFLAELERAYAELHAPAGAVAH